LQNPRIIFFFVGGVTAHEVREIKEQFAKLQVEVVVGSTTVATPSKLLLKISSS
jgi:hypothetical protein